MDRLVTPAEAASLLGVSTRTLDRYVTEGRVIARTLPSGHRRYVEAELITLIRSAPQPEET